MNVDYTTRGAVGLFLRQFAYDQFISEQSFTSTKIWKKWTCLTAWQAEHLCAIWPYYSVFISAVCAQLKDSICNGIMRIGYKRN